MRLQFAIPRFAWPAAVLFTVTLASAAEVPQDPRQRGPVIGVIDGVPIYEGAVRVDAPTYRKMATGEPSEVEAARRLLECTRLNGLLWNAALNKEMKHRRLAIPDNEAQAARHIDLASAETRDTVEEAKVQATTLIAALEAVKAGADPEAEYRLHLASHGFTRQGWDSVLAKAADPAFVQGLKAGVQKITPEAVVGGMDRYQNSQVLWKKRLVPMMDQEIAASDPKFAAALPSLQRDSIPQDDYRYIETRRLAWWHERSRQLHVIIYDRQLAKQCPISDGQVRLDAITK
ncbi:MAG: hypothetical protein ABI693_14500 [Bryobacteraceae bacterium]